MLAFWQTGQFLDLLVGGRAQLHVLPLGLSAKLVEVVVHSRIEGSLERRLSDILSERAQAVVFDRSCLHNRLLRVLHRLWGRHTSEFGILRIWSVVSHLLGQQYIFHRDLPS